MNLQPDQLTGASCHAQIKTGGSQDSSWLPAPAQLRASHDEVHVWRVSLEETHASKLQSLLDDDERMRAARYRFPEHRNRFIVARGALRSILGVYLDTEATALRFSYSDYGKPALAEGSPGTVPSSNRANRTRRNRRFSLRTHLRLVSSNPLSYFSASQTNVQTPALSLLPEKGRETNQLNFNLSHSRGFMLLAVTRGREVGVDIELIDREFATAEVAERFFSQREIFSLRSQPNPLQTEAFFNCWTRKEAYIKARGEGLTLPLDQFDVSLDPSGASLLENRIFPGDRTRWSLQELHPAPDYCAAVAVEGFSWKLRLLDFNSSSLV